MPPSTIGAVRDYVSRMCTDREGMKVLVMDAETTGIVSMVYTQTQILQHEVFLIEAIERERTEKMPHLKAIYFLRPTVENINRLKQEFSDPKYGEYNLYFSNLTRDGQVQQLAEADELEVVRQVQEYYADYLAINTDLFSLNVPSVAGLAGAVWDQAAFDRIQQGVVALLLSLKKRPVIRYQRNSEIAMRVAETVSGTMDTESDLFSYRRTDPPPLLLLLDRRDDPVTPLLNQWTYQAMVHELIGINNNRVSLAGAPKVPKELEQIVLSAEQDPFFNENMHLNYGDLAENVKRLLDAFQAKTKSSKSISSIADMQSFVEEYPQFRKLSGDVSKHVTLLGEINRLVDVGQLMEVSQVEQELACTEDHPSAASEVETLLSKDSVSHANKLRLVLLYSLRYEHLASNRIAQFCEMLPAEDATMVQRMLANYGSAQRSGDLFSNKSWLAVTKKQFQRGLKGVQNVYTQHTPYLAATLESTLKATLSENTFPYMGAEPQAASKKKAPTEVIVFLLGGATYEEARYVAEMNTANPGVHVTLGGTTIHSSRSFLEELGRMPTTASAEGAAASSASMGNVIGGISAMGIAPPIDRKRIAALTSSMGSQMTSSMQSMTQNMSAAMSKLQ
uniref:Vacuolar protein sorting-associated protein 45 n=1 Tax=Coccolithus braarudii TaxID=221442 RepID=A0A7S0LML6_9EUKA|mmetsp:Transcript_48709/g.103959  ORF Transcript_48709/g.103959 Transcript_48709/m.103959 type:complete len:620 (+) Transcript_48709:101-1960(+)